MAATTAHYTYCHTLALRDALPGCPTFLRNATAFGASPRMRFDLVMNNLAGVTFTTGRIVMTSDGAPWRPLVHIRDISAAEMRSEEHTSALQSLMRISYAVFS